MLTQPCVMYVLADYMVEFPISSFKSKRPDGDLKWMMEETGLEIAPARLRTRHLRPIACGFQHICASILLGSAPG